MLEAILEQIPFYIDRLNAAAFADILLVTAIIFVMLIVIRGTRAVQLLRGLLIIVALVALATSFIDLPAFNLVFQTIFPALLVAFPVLFQPELRRALDKAGRTGQFLRFFRRNERSPMLDAIGNACLHLSQRRHGALIVIEQETGLQEYVDTGILLDAEPSPEL
ncbi:MAG: diadenylate cyclase, partial [Anaerolineales bacterium]|nr:diadenylate cyclase [Anaerolineales bacterium]